MSSLRIDAITKRWDGSPAVDRVSFSAAAGRFVVLLGPSGCGKSTTLRMIAGLETPDEGRIFIGERDVTDLPPAERGLSMVFQSYALFPHLTVAENIVFGLRVRNVPRAERERRLRKVAHMTSLDELLSRKPAQLSGGQRQRVALARAIVAEHPVCLMDEPLSNLDAKLRHEMRVELRKLQQQLGMTVVYVTHDQIEAMSMADDVVLMRAGRIEQASPPQTLYAEPATTFAASFIGTPPMNLIATEAGEHGTVIAGTSIKVPGVIAGDLIGIRPEHIRLREHGGVPATAESTDYHGADTVLTAAVGGQQVHLRLPGHLRINPGEPLHLYWRAEDTRLFDAASGRRREAIASALAMNY